MQGRINYKRLVTITLVFLMTFTCLMEPIGLLAIEDTEARESENQNASYLLMKTTSEININDEIIINPDTYLYGTESNEAEYEFVYNDQQITVTKNEVEIISEGENLEIASFIENVESDVEELQDFAASKQFYRLTEYETYETIILLKDTTLPVYKDEDAKSFIVIGNTKFYVEKPEMIEETPEEPIQEEESSEEIVEEPIQEEESSEEIAEEPIQEEETLNEKEQSSEVIEKTEEENSTQNIMVQSQAAQLRVVDVWANTTANYFEVIKDNVVVYDNRTGSLVKVGELKKNQVYVIVSDYGDWHRIQLGDYYGYVLKSNTIPANNTAIKNENINFENQDRVFITQQKVPVYDNSSGSLIEFGEIDAGREYAIASDYGSNWWRVIYGGRVGYVSKSNVRVQTKASDKYFEVAEEDLTVYDRDSGKLVKVGELEKGQVYPRVSDYGNWHKIQFGDSYGYVYKAGTKYTTKEIKNENTSYQNISRTFKTNGKTAVYDNSSGGLVRFGEIESGVEYTIVSEYGDWWRIIYAGRVGYVRKENVSTSFSVSDKYFQVKETDLEVYDNRSGKLVSVGELESGQVYPRVSDYGDWHKVQFGDSYGYVYKAGTEYTTKGIKNENTSYQNQSRTFNTKEKTSIYDNSSGDLVRFGELNPGIEYTIVSEYGNWWRVIYAGRVGYILKSNVIAEFLPGDKYFEVLTDNLPIYDNRSGELEEVGSLVNGQSYEIVSDYGDWHRIRFDDYYGYVNKNNTAPTDGKKVNNKNTSYTNGKEIFTTTNSVPVYDNSSGKLVKFGSIKSGHSYHITGEYGSNWWRIIFAGRVGYVSKNAVEIGFSVAVEKLPVYSSFDELAYYNRQSAITTLYYNDKVQVLEERKYAMKIKVVNTNIEGWIHSGKIDDYLSDNNWLIKDTRNLRQDSSTNSSIIGSVTANSVVNVLEYEYYANEATYKDWYRIQTADGTIGWIWGGGTNGYSLVQYEKPFYNGTVNNITLFTPLNSKSTITANQINRFIASKTSSSSYLYNMGQSFIDAQNQTGVNAIYLLAHSIHETAYGNSSIVKEKYNYYGIGAFDACPSTCANNFEGKNAGIINGANWISTYYINRDAYKQFTLYSMRNNNNVHQYATDQAWDVKIVDIVNEILEYNKLN